MQMIPVDSSNISSVGYENGTLYVNFHSRNSLYSYSNVPLSVFEALLNASSKGKYFAANIKNCYAYTRLR